jgi:acyl-coenzyme A synthetase/AMP-(fatty) acid ligase
MTLWEAIARRAGTPGGPWLDAGRGVALESLASASILGGRLETLRGRSVMITTEHALTAALALIELDGVARRMVLCTPGLAPEHIPQIVRDAQVDAWVTDAASGEPPPGLASISCIAAHRMPQPCAVDRRSETSATEWVLLTSGTTGGPKLVAHTLASLTAAFALLPRGEQGAPIWSTFYDIRRYGGLQILLRALFFGSLLLPAAADEPPREFLARAAAAGVTHISGTPSHWRKALMSGAAEQIRPGYVRLSGEIADQPILDALRAAFPHAVVAHAFASTEAGVAFEVQDGLAGFPASLAGTSAEGVRIDVSRGTLRIKSPGNASRYLGEGAPPIKDGEGFVDLGDKLELRGDRWYFIGRSGGIINVGGLKVHPEEVEAVINSHPKVRMSLVKPRRNPITGTLVTAEVVLVAGDAGESGEGAETPAKRICGEILATCRERLAAHKVPALIRVVPVLEVSASGKLVRRDA